MKTALGGILIALLLMPAMAFAQPGNDDRDSAERVAVLPVVLHGTVSGADLEAGEVTSPCVSKASSVWYRLDPKRTRRLIVRLRAGGDLDAGVDVFERVRSTQRLLTCAPTDRRGRAAVAFHAVRGRAYLVRVVRRAGSAPDRFSLSMRGGAGVPRLPGLPLPARGISAELDRVSQRANAWALDLREGVRERISLLHPGNACIGGALYAPGASLSSAPVATLGCDGYALYAPRRSGRYSVVIRASSNDAGRQRYVLTAGRAGRDDSAPGQRVSNYGRVDDRLGGLDRIDLLRFDVTRRSVLFLHLRTAARNGFDVQLLDARGHQILCGCATHGSQMLHKGLKRGRYFVAVRARGRARGRYTLLRASRTITKSHLTVQSGRLTPGLAQQISVQTVPPVNGPVTVVIEQFDPLAGWQYLRSIRTRAAGGVATVSYVAPTIGSFRATATYDGTRGRAPSAAGFARFGVFGDLRE